MATVNYIPPIFDRTKSDVDYAEANPNDISKGAYNYTDLNRVCNNLRYAADIMLEKKIVTNPIQLDLKMNWVETDIATQNQMVNYIISNLNYLRTMSVEALPWVAFNYVGQMDYTIANAIEKNIQYLIDQELPPPNKFYLEVEDGTGTDYYLDKTVVPIQAYASPPDMMFWKWSGEEWALKLIGNLEQPLTTFRVDMSYGERTKIKAEYTGVVPHKLTVTNGKGSGNYLMGTNIEIYAEPALLNKVFHHWEGTEEMLKNLVSVSASTTTLAMPNVDGTLTAVYIEPGPHRLQVYGGTPADGYYEYNESVFISATVGQKYKFNRWNGDTAYMDSEQITSPSAVITMPDKHISVSASTSYVPDTDIELVVENGTGSGKFTETHYMPISPGPAPEEGQIFHYWTRVEGDGSISDVNSSSTTVRMGVKKTVVRAVYRTPIYKQLIVNGGTGSGMKDTILRANISATIPSDHVFDKWTGDISGIYNSRAGSTYFDPMGNNDREVTAHTRPKNIYTLTVENGDGSSDSVIENSYLSIKAKAADPGYEFAGWSRVSGSGSFNNSNNMNTTIGPITSDTVVRATYRLIPNSYKLTVDNGTTTTTNTYRQGTRVDISGRSPQSWEDFKKWEQDGPGTIGNPETRSTYIVIGAGDVTVRATYIEYPDRSLIVNRGVIKTPFNGIEPGKFRHGTNVTIQADDAPEDEVFLSWEGNWEAVYSPLASTTYIKAISKDTSVTATYHKPEEPEYYTLTVINGMMTGRYAAGSKVEVNADFPREGYEFWRWDDDIQNMVDRYAEKAMIVMPKKNITVTAKYRRKGTTDLYTLNVAYGQGKVTLGEGEEAIELEGPEIDAPSGTKIEVTANPPAWGQEFSRWTGIPRDVAQLDSLYEPKTVFTMGEFDSKIEATYRTLDRYQLIVRNGYGTGQYFVGENATIAGDKIDDEDTRYEFKKWIVIDGDPKITDPTELETSLTMPAEDVTVEAEYITRRKLTVVNGTQAGSGYYEFGEKVKIKAGPPPENQIFYEWAGDTSILSNKYNPEPTVTMPNSIAQVTAIYVTTIIKENSVATCDLVLTEGTSELKREDTRLISGYMNIGTIVFDPNGSIGIIELVNPDDDPDTNDYNVRKLFRGGNW